MLFKGESRPEIIDYAARRLDEGADTVAVAKELMSKWPHEINDLETALSLVVLAKQSVRK
jgi:hypothetical protein